MKFRFRFAFLGKMEAFFFYVKLGVLNIQIHSSDCNRTIDSSNCVFFINSDIFDRKRSRVANA